jgi:hypothetical protein
VTVSAGYAQVLGRQGLLLDAWSSKGSFRRVGRRESAGRPVFVRDGVIAPNHPSVAVGSGRSKQFAEMQKVMKQMGALAKGGRLPKIPGMRT